jgi:3-oxoacyl-[acyl-carrier-protein] synthase-3
MGQSEQAKAYLNYVSYLLAPNCITNEDLAKRFPEYTPEKIFKNTGIKKRFAVDEETLSSDFATACGEKFFQEFPVKKEDIDFLIFCTECPDYVAPATSCIIQHKLGLPISVGTMDLSFGCSGYSYGLSMAKALVESRMAQNVLFVTADIPTEFLPPNNTLLNLLFSDGASANLISLERTGRQLTNFVFGTDGSGERNLMIKNSAFKEAKSADWYNDSENSNLPVGRMEMNGEAIFRFSLERVPELVKEILQKNNCKFGEIDLFVFHQASRIILKSLQRKLNIPEEKFFTNLADVGNTVSASIPIALVEAEKQRKIKPSMKILIAGFGVGYSWSGTILKT